MITKTDLQVLNDYKAETGRVLSVYLDVDQSKAANLNRKFEAAFEAKIKEIAMRQFGGQTPNSATQEFGVCPPNSEEVDFAECVAEARNVIAAYHPHARDWCCLPVPRVPFRFES